jgi:myo-inositol 2-dehydrogenase/D-chiro-inositol 1-dehydrogenase
MGAGRIGKMHADIINSHPECNLIYVYDINKKFASELANKYDANSTITSEEALTNKDIDAVLIASATPTHIEFITKASKSGKAVFCEKPIDLDISKVNTCFEELKNIKNLIQIGFNRRFDNSHRKLQEARITNEIGQLELVVITSRDPEPPGIDYLKAAGGFFRDTTIHDFDLSRFILGEDPVTQVSAFASTLISEDARQVGDHDTAMFILKSKKGVLIHINNSRRAVYGYDQRVEIFGSNGMMISGNQSPTSVEKFSTLHTKANDPIHYFFIERYAQAYKDQFNNFVQAIKSKSQPSVSFEDGRNALIIANAAYESLETGKTVNINYE